MGELKSTKQKVIAATQERADNWVNMVNGLGDVSRDRTAAARFCSRGGSAADLQYWESVFAEDPIAHRIAHLPAKEMLRQGFRMDLGDTAGDDQAPIMAEYDRLGASTALIEAMTFGRALGGGAVFIGADDNRPLEMPLDMKRIRNVAFLKPLSRRELTPLSWYSNPLHVDPEIRAKFGEVETYTMSLPSNGGATSANTITIHESRLLLFQGTVTTAQRRAMQQGWGDSIYVQIEQSLSLLWQSVSGLANALSDADQGIFKLEGLLDILRAGSEGDEAIRKRLSLLQHGRSVARAIALDAKNESFEYVARTFAGYDTGVFALMFILSAACGIPVTLLFGRSPAGLNATGESDVRFFYDNIKGDQEMKLLQKLRKLMEIIMSAQEGPMKGKVPAEWSITFRPLMQSSPTEKADIRLKTAQADQIFVDLGEVSVEEARSSHFGGDEFDPDITLDPDLDTEVIAEDKMEKAGAMAEVMKPAAPAPGAVPPAKGAVKE